MELFKKMGPRVILVEQRGKLMGLVTVKDCLRYQFKVEAQENATTANGATAMGSHGENEGAVDTLEEKVWSFLQKVGQTLRLIKTRSIRLDGSARVRHGQNEGPAEGTDEHQYGILEGTEENDPVELEDRVR
jgi:chloride channel 3/4/5